MKKVLLILFILICLFTSIYSGYLLFNKQISPITGSILLAIGIILLVWSWSLIRKHSLSGGAVFIALLIIAIFAGATGAYAGVQPFSNTKDKVATWVKTVSNNIDKSNQANEKKREPYVVISGDIFQTRNTVVLTTVNSWTGSESKKIRYKPPKAPWVVNVGYTPTSKLASKFEVRIYKQLQDNVSMQVNFYGNTLIQDTGEYVIEVEASGCEWWVKVGLE